MTTFEKLQRRIGGFPIEYPAAALMAGAVAFCVLAAPDWRFESAVNASGLPGIVAAAQPPLGTTARILAAVALAALSFLAVWFGLRALDARPEASDFPAFRAADLHPDAPRRRPILAGAEFGAPADDLPPIEEQVNRRKPLITEPMPSFLAPQPPVIADFMHEPVAEPEYIEIEEDADPAPVVAREDAAEEPPADPVGAEELHEPLHFETTRTVPDEQAAPPIADAPQAASSVSSDPVDDDHQVEPSVGDLMARLESGLSRSGSRPVPGPSGAAQEELRRALGALNRVSGRG